MLKGIWHVVNKKSARHYFQAHSQLGNSHSLPEGHIQERKRLLCPLRSLRPSRTAHIKALSSYYELLIKTSTGKNYRRAITS